MVESAARRHSTTRRPGLWLRGRWQCEEDQSRAATQSVATARVGPRQERSTAWGQQRGLRRRRRGEAVAGGAGSGRVVGGKCGVLCSIN